MWYEYAVDPVALAASWDRFRSFYDAFGWEHGRLLSRYPKKWETLFHDALLRSAASPIQQQRMQYRLQQEKAFRLISAKREFDNTKPWLENALSHQAVKPFHAILAEANHDGHQTIVCMDDCDDNHPLWRSPQTKPVPRAAAVFAAEARVLLERATEILFIDPYFDPNASRFLDSLAAMLKAISFSNGGILRVELHTGDAGAFTNRGAAAFETRTRQELRRLLPQGAKLECTVWHVRSPAEPGERFHNRYLLTDLGGLCLPGGLDESEVAGQTEELVRLSEASRKKQWADFQLATRAHSLAHPTFSITGA